MAITLNQAIHQNTDGLSFINRFYQSASEIIKNKEWTTLMAGGLFGTVSVAYSVAFSYFCMEGVVRSYEEVSSRNDSLVGLRPLGDAGGWTMLTLFAALTVENIFVKLVREGEYFKLKTICQKWTEDNIENIKKDKKFHKNYYKKLNLLFDSFNSSCLFSKSLASRRLNALEIYKKSGLPDKGKEVINDRKLEEILFEIQCKVEKKTSWTRYFQRAFTGIKVVCKGNYFEKIATLTKGIAIPVIFTGMAALSYIGEYALGLDIYRDHQNLTDVGHFGEWPFNAIEGLAVGLFLHQWCIINEGDFQITRKIYKKVLNAFKEDPVAYNRIRKLANEDLAQQSLNCQYAKLPIDYQFEAL